MKIIVQGTKPATCLHGKCGACGCVFECDRSEVSIVWHSDEGDSLPCVKCPNCSHYVHAVSGHYSPKAYPSERD